MEGLQSEKYYNKTKVEGCSRKIRYDNCCGILFMFSPVKKPRRTKRVTKDSICTTQNLTAHENDILCRLEHHVKKYKENWLGESQLDMKRQPDGNDT